LDLDESVHFRQFDYFVWQEKKRAEERAKLLDQMDEEFGISSLVEKEMKPTGPSYTSRDLKGLKVAHDQAMFKEGATTILTLADKGVTCTDTCVN